MSTKVAVNLVINEVLANPKSGSLPPGTTGVTDSNGEWFEIYNAGSLPVNLKGFLINDYASGPSTPDYGSEVGPSGSTHYARAPHAIASDVIIPSGGYAVLGNSINTAVNGGVPVDYAYGSTLLQLSNTADGVRIMSPDSVLIDKAFYGSAATSAQDGISRELNDPSLDNLNIDGSNWSSASVATTFGVSPTPPTRGTPKARNFAFLVGQPEMNATITRKPSNPANSTNATFEFTKSRGDGESSFDYSLESGEFANCTSPLNLIGLSPGWHTIAVREKDSSGNAEPSPAIYSWFIDATTPMVSTVKRATANPVLSGSTVDFTVTFSEAVTGVDAADFEVTTTGVSGANITSVAGSGTTYTVTVGTGSGAGTIRLDVVDNDSIIDVAGNSLGGTGVGNGSYTAGESYTVGAQSHTISGFAPASGPVGTTVTISGTDFTGATSVTFDGGTDTAATILTNNGTQITVEVPEGATTGTISVTANGSTVTSTTEFTVADPRIVTTISDDSSSTDGFVSLREALAYANAHSGVDSITFALPEIDKGDDIKWTIAPTSALPTIDEGVSIDGAKIVTLSGRNAGGRNSSDALVVPASGLVIASSGSTIKGLHFSGWNGNGIRVDSGNNNNLRGNTFSGNNGISINLAGGTEDPNGVNTNDAGDIDSGANNLQNSPVLTKARTPQSAAGTTVEGKLQGQTGVTYTIDFYSSSAAHASGYGEGATRIGTTTVSVRSNNVTSFGATLPVQPVGSIITAIATDAGGNSSEFSNSTVNSDDVTDPTVTVSTPANGGSVSKLMSIAGNASDIGTGIVRVESFLRYKDNNGILQYWAKRGGNWGWGSDILSIPASLTDAGTASTGWNITNDSPTGTVLPSGANLPARTYYLLAYAYDAAGNKARSATPDTSFVVTVPVAPAVTVT
ncbi:MAG TPA: lamin tail domain-containing protein, partial [Abditibacteriaceae bacterium]